MSGDMFRKMKDHLTPSTNNQQIINNNSIPIQTLPELPEPTLNQNNHNLIDVGPFSDKFEEDESEISPQHQLFDERSIQKITPNFNPIQTKPIDGKPESRVRDTMDESNRCQAVIDIEDISSDLEDDIPLNIDNAEIDLLSDGELLNNPHSDKSTHYNVPSNDSLDIYKTRYRSVVHFLRKLANDHSSVKCKLEGQINQLTSSLAALRTELEAAKKTQSSLSTSTSENDKTSASSAQPTSRSSSKIKDLEKLIAKCKESLKAKNAQLKILKDSVANVDRFKDSINELKQELGEIRGAHESWTVSIAEGKCIMHQEIETKNIEIMGLQHQLKESFSKSVHLKSIIQKLESQLVSMSAAHQKERESLIKELTTAKNIALKQALKDHDLQLERVKLDFEKSIEVFKTEILSKDEQICREVERQQKLQEQKRELLAELESTKAELNNSSKSFSELSQTHERCSKEIVELKAARDDLKVRAQDSEDLEANKRELEDLVLDLRSKLKQAESNQVELETKLKNNETNVCEKCNELQQQISETSERCEQVTFDLKTQLHLMTTANGDQEKELNVLVAERDSANELLKSLKIELDELGQKNEALLRLNRDNELELQTQQEQLENLASIQQELDNLKREHVSQVTSCEQLKLELGERISELHQSKAEVDELRCEMGKLEERTTNLIRSCDELRAEKEILQTNHSNDLIKRNELEQQLVIKILSAMKNLETPETSPGSDKNYKPVSRQDVVDDKSLNEKTNDSNNKTGLPNPVDLVDDLSSLALDRSTAHMTTTQRLQAVLLDNTMISEELKRLKDELNTMSQEKSQETMYSLNELERLQTENQALIHDQKAYEDQIYAREAELEALGKQLEQLDRSKNSGGREVSVTNEVSPPEAASLDSKQAENVVVVNGDEDDVESQLRSRDAEIETLKRIVADREKQVQILKESNAINVPDSTQFEYLKNIVHQFMLGREPLVLARVISAVFKFDKSQVDQICRVQEAVQASLKPTI